MTVVVISDLHLGNRHCRAEAFLRLLGTLPAGATLVLNGDIMDRTRLPPPPLHLQVLDALRAASRERAVIWIRGNHDDGFQLENPAGIRFAESFALAPNLLVTHGDRFDTIMPYGRPLLRLFKALHGLRVRLGAESVHVAHYAKKFPMLYRVLRRHVRLNAVAHAREHGFDAIACGHTHAAEDSVVDGVRYFNTGAWTEPTPHVLTMEGGRLTLRSFDAAG